MNSAELLSMIADEMIQAGAPIGNQNAAGPHNMSKAEGDARSLSDAASKSGKWADHDKAQQALSMVAMREGKSELHNLAIKHRIQMTEISKVRPNPNPSQHHEVNGIKLTENVVGESGRFHSLEGGKTWRSSSGDEKREIYISPAESIHTNKGFQAEVTNPKTGVTQRSGVKLTLESAKEAAASIHKKINASSASILDSIKAGAPAGHEFYGNQHTDGKGGLTESQTYDRIREHDSIRHNGQVNAPEHFMAHTASINAYSIAEKATDGSGRASNLDAAKAHLLAAGMHRSLGNNEYADTHDKLAAQHVPKYEVIPNPDGSYKLNTPPAVGGAIHWSREAAEQSSAADHATRINHIRNQVLPSTYRPHAYGGNYASADSDG